MVSPGPRSAPAGLRVAAVILALESLAALVYGVAETLQAQPGRLGVGLGVGLLLVGYGVALASVGRGLILLRRWSRGPAVATQLIHLPVAWGFREGNVWVTVLVGGLALVTLVAVLLPSSTLALTAADRPR